MSRGETVADDLRQAILRREAQAVEPVLEPGRPAGFYYPFLEAQDLDPADPGPLEEMVTRGELERTVRHRLLLCPRDGSHHLRPALQCPSCRSEALSQAALVEHLPCGHIAPEADFRHEDGLVCPKCRKRLKLVGKDYRRPGDFHRCSQCGEVTYVPEVTLHCPFCDGYFEVAEARIRDLAVYERPATVRKDLDRILASAAAALRETGYRVTLLGERPGRSGVDHSVDLHAEKEVSGLTTEIVLDVALAAAPVSSRPLVDLFGKAEDLGVSAVLFVAVPGLQDDARRYATYHGMRVLETDREELEERIQAFLADELLLGRPAGEG